MSLQFEATATNALPPLPTAGRRYRQYVFEDFACHENPSPEIEKNPFFQASMQLVRLWRSAPGVCDTPEDQEIQSDLMTWADDNLPDKTALDQYLGEVLHAGQQLVSERTEPPSPELEVDVQDMAIDRALRLRSMLSTHQSEKLTYFLQQQFAAACTTAVLNLENFAMPPMPHQIVDNLSNVHDGVLLEHKRNVINPCLRYSVAYGCGGFAEGHNQGGREPLLAMRYKRVRLLSACCDLRLLKQSNDGRKDLDDILDILINNREGLARHGDVDLIHQLGRGLANTIMLDESRRGTRLTNRQGRKKRYMAQKA